MYFKHAESQEQYDINYLFLSLSALSFALRSMYRCDECPDQWCEAVLCTATLLCLPDLQQRSEFCFVITIINYLLNKDSDIRQWTCLYLYHSPLNRITINKKMFSVIFIGSFLFPDFALMEHSD